MKVKARHNVQDRNGWHLPGTVFETEEDLGEAVEILSGENPPESAREPEAVPEPKAEEPKEAKPAARRRKR